MKALLIIVLLTTPALAKNTGVDGHSGIRIPPAAQMAYPLDTHISTKTVCRYRVSNCWRPLPK